jgi:hypothetical protein
VNVPLDYTGYYYVESKALLRYRNLNTLKGWGTLSGLDMTLPGQMIPEGKSAIFPGLQRLENL